MRRRRVLAALVTAAVIALTGCSGTPTSDAQAPSVGGPQLAETTAPSSPPTPPPSLAVPEASANPFRLNIVGTGEEAFMRSLRENTPQVLDALPGVGDQVFLEWGQGMCDVTDRDGAFGLIGQLTQAFSLAGGEEYQIEQATMDLAVAATALQTLCPEHVDVVDQLAAIGG
jgi:hypothetical protein